MAIKKVNYTLACDSLKECLNINPSFWPSIDTLICLLYALGDYISCLHLIQHSLSLNTSFQRALCVKAQIEEEDPFLFKNFSWKQGLADLKPSDSATAKEMEYPKELREKDQQAKKQSMSLKTDPVLFLRELCPKDPLADLGIAICELFVKSKEEDLSLFCPVDFSKSNLDALLSKPQPNDTAPQEEQPKDSPGIVPPEVSTEEGAKEKEGESSESDPQSKAETKVAKETEVKERKEGQRRSKRVQDLQSEANDPLESLTSQLDTWIPDILRFSDDSSPKSSSLTKDTISSGQQERQPKLIDESELLKKITDVQDTTVLLIPLMKNYCNQLSAHFHEKWSRTVTKSFLNVYFSYREYEALPNILQNFEQQDTEENVLTLMCAFEIIVNYDLFPGVNLEDKYFLDIKSFITKGALDKDQEFLRTAHQHERIKEMFSTSNMYDSFQLRYAWAYCLYEEKLGNVECSLEFAKLCITKKKDAEIDELVIANNNVPFINEESLDKQRVNLIEIQERENVTNLFKEKNYTRVVELLKPMLDETNHDLKTDYAQTPIRHKNLLILLESLRKLSMMENCLKCAEILLHELVPYLRFTDTCKSLLTKILKSLSVSMLECDYKSEIISYGRAMSNIVKVIVKYFETLYKEGTALASLSDYPIDRALIIYHMIIDKCVLEGLSEVDVVSTNVARIQSLAMCHDLLGEHSLCTLNNGVFLSYVIDCCYKYKIKNIFIEDATDLIEQAIFCYIGHPGPGSKRSKKNRVEHGGSHSRLTLEIALKIFKFYCPDEMFNPMEKTKHLSADTFEIMTQTVSLFEEEISKTDLFMMIKLSMEKGKVPSYKKLDEKSDRKNFGDIYYLCGDYLWKYGEFLQAIDWFVCDLAINPDRIQSWLCIGLCWLSIAEDRFNHAKSDLKIVIESIAPKAVLCFDHYMSSSSTSFDVASEYSIFLYTIASVYNQVAGALADNVAVIQEIDLKRLTLITKAKEVLLKGVDPVKPSSWVKNFMLGKIHEKLNSKDLTWLECYSQALKDLGEYSHTVTKKINTSSPVEYSMECMELVFRISYSIYKRSTEIPDLTKDPSKKKNMLTHLKRVVELMCPLTTQVEFEKSSITKLVLLVLGECFLKWPENYKIRNALCKIIHETSTADSDDYVKAKSLMLQDSSNSSGMFLFTRKHLFLGIWRIPVDTVDRPGGFFRHMRKSLSLIIASLTHCKDISNLIKLFENMVKTAEQLNNFVGDVTPFLQTSLTQFDTLLRTRVSEYCGSPSKHSTEHSIKLLKLCIKVKNIHVRSGVETKPVDEAILVILKLFKLTVPQQIAICDPRVIDEPATLYDTANKLINDFEQVAALLELEKQKKKDIEKASSSQNSQPAVAATLPQVSAHPATTPALSQTAQSVPSAKDPEPPAKQPAETREKGTENVPEPSPSIQSEKIVVNDAAKTAVRQAVASFITQMAEKNSSSKANPNVSQILTMINNSVKSKENSAKIREILLKAVSKPNQSEPPAEAPGPPMSQASVTTSMNTSESPSIATPAQSTNSKDTHQKPPSSTPSTSIKASSKAPEVKVASLPSAVNSITPSDRPPSVTPVSAAVVPINVKQETHETATSNSVSPEILAQSIKNEAKEEDPLSSTSLNNSKTNPPETEPGLEFSSPPASTSPPEVPTPTTSACATPTSNSSASPEAGNKRKRSSSLQGSGSENSDSDDEGAMPSLDDVPALDNVPNKTPTSQSSFRTMPNLNLAHVNESGPPMPANSMPHLNPPMLVKKEPTPPPSSLMNSGSYLQSPPPMYCRSSSEPNGVPNRVGANGGPPNQFIQPPVGANKMPISSFMHLPPESARLSLTPAQLMALNVPNKKGPKTPRVKKERAPRKKKVKEPGLVKKREKKRKIDKVQTLKQFDFPHVDKTVENSVGFYPKSQPGLNESSHVFRRGMSEIHQPSTTCTQPQPFFRQNSEPILQRGPPFDNGLLNRTNSDEVQYKAEDFFAGSSSSQVNSPAKSGFMSDSPYSNQSNLLLSPSANTDSSLFSPTSSENLSSEQIIDDDSQLENVDLGILNELDGCDLTDEQERLRQVVPKPKRGRKPKDPNKPKAPPKKRKPKAKAGMKAQMNGMLNALPGAGPFTSPTHPHNFPGYQKPDGQFQANPGDDTSPTKYFYYPDGSMYPAGNAAAKLAMMPPSLQPHTVQQPAQLDQLQHCSPVGPPGPSPVPCQYSSENTGYVQSAPASAGPLSHYSPDDPSPNPKLNYNNLQYTPVSSFDPTNMYSGPNSTLVKQDPLEQAGMVKDSETDPVPVGMNPNVGFGMQQYPVTQPYSAEMFPTSLYPDHSGFNSSAQMSTAPGSSVHPPNSNFNQYQNFRNF